MAVADQTPAGIGERLFGAFDETTGMQTRRGLLDILRDTGLKIGPRERVAVATLLAELSARTGDLQPDLLRASLAPLLARSAQEREDFHRVFEAFWRTEQPILSAPASKPALAADVAARKPWRQRVSWPLVAMVAIGGLVIALLVMLAWTLLRSAPDNKEPERRPPVEVQRSEAIAPQASQDIAAPKAFASLDRIRAAAAPYSGAPTLQELSTVLQSSSSIGWSAAAYAERLHELTGLPQSTPLDLVGLTSTPGANTADVWARLARGLEQIETPGRTNPPNALRAAARARLATEGTDAFPAQQLANKLQLQLAGGAPLPPDQTSALARARTALGENVDEDLLARALAIVPDARLRRAYEDAPWLDAFTPREARQAPWWLAWLLLSAPLGLAALWLSDSLSVRKAYLRRRKPEFPPLHMDLLADALKHTQQGAAFFHRIGQRLQRRTARPTDQLDIEATIRATIADGGLFVRPVVARARAAPDYLVLIERRGAGDQDFERLRMMVLRLKDLIAIEVFTYQTEPSLLEPEGGGRAIPIERLMAAYPEHRLLVLGSGSEFLDAVTLKPLAGPAKLMHWDRRALLTPVPLAEWAQEEFALARELSLPIGRATPEGLASLAELLRLEGVEDDDLLDASGDGAARALPQILRVRPQRFLYGDPPDDHPVEQIVQDLRNYLDPAGFDWLCATAVYPAVQWDLTLYLGVALPERVGGDIQIEPLYREDRIGALTQLPWLREGVMPNWLRRALIGAMAPERADEVRAALRRLIEAARASGDPALDETVRMRILREAPRDRLAPDELFEDEVLLDFMARAKIEDFELPQQALLDRFLPKDWRHRFGVPEMAMLGVCAAWSAAAFLLAPKSSDGPLVTGAWLPVKALVAGGLLAYLLTHAGTAYAWARARVERLASTGLVLTTITGLFALGPIIVAGMASGVNAIGGGQASTAWLPLLGLAILAWVLAVPLSRMLVRALGIYAPPAKGGWMRRFMGGAAELVVVTAMAIAARALLDFEFGGRARAWMPLVLIGGAGLLVFALGAIASRFAPERLPAPPKRPMSARANWLAGAGRIAFALIPMAPALALAAHVNATQTIVPAPTLAGVTRPAEPEAVATTPDGRYFALGGADGIVRVFESTAPRRTLATIRTQSGPVHMLALRQTATAPLKLAVASTSGRVSLYDGRTGAPLSAVETPGGVAPPIVALGDDGGWALGYETAQGVAQLSINGGPPTELEGGPVTALTALPNGAYAVGLLSGDVQFVGEGAPRILPVGNDLAGITGQWRPVGATCANALIVQVEGMTLIVRQGGRIERTRILGWTKEGDLRTVASGAVWRWRREDRPASLVRTGPVGEEVLLPCP